MADQTRMRIVIALDRLDVPSALLSALDHNSPDGAGMIIRPEESRLAVSSAESGFCRDPIGSTDLAAILFTSGSSGNPKGVPLHHDACINLCQGHMKAQRICASDRILLAASPSFIMGLRELCMPLLSGAASVPVSRALLDEPEQLLRIMSQTRVSVAMFTPSFLRLLQGAASDDLRCLITAGERPNAEDARVYARRLEYWNIYGAAEACGTICMCKVDPYSSGPIPAGAPFQNTSVYLLDPNGQEVRPGEFGEIYVTGRGVARGYLIEQQQSPLGFVRTLDIHAYRSGDLGRRRADGLIETAGRIDDAMKISGQYVRLSELDETLLRHELVRRAATVQHEKTIATFIETTDLRRAEQQNWREYLAAALPSYMLPHRISVLTEMPLNSSGKVDRRELLSMASAAVASKVRVDLSEFPLTAIEQCVAGILKDVLDVDYVTLQESFVSLGGNSLLAISVSQKLTILGYVVSAHTILFSQTLTDLVASIENGDKGQPLLST
jgi:acyl-coenzyme A synthetase/AMP-(fatty) acid ligase